MKYPFQRSHQMCSNCRNYNLVSPFLNVSFVIRLSNTPGDSCRTWSAYPPEAPGIPPFLWVCVAQSLVFCVVFCVSCIVIRLFVLLSSHGVVSLYFDLSVGMFLWYHSLFQIENIRLAIIYITVILEKRSKLLYVSM